jgi:hypothetical protein
MQAYQHYKSLCFLRTLKNQIAVFGSASLNDGHILAGHDEIRTACQGGEKSIQRFSIRDFPTIHLGEEAIELRELGVG